jgi:hypothetical protein
MAVDRLPIVGIAVRSLDVDRKEVTWELPDTASDPLDFDLEVLRSESPEGPWDVITAPFVDRYIFVDARIPVGDKYRKLWYKIRVTHRATATAMDYGPAAQEADPDLIAMAMRRHALTYLSQVTGRLVWLFKKRSFGPRCHACWDRETNQRIRANCHDCFNTGFLRGYMNPIEIWMQIDPATEKQNGQCSARTGYYPTVRPGDLIVEAENIRWKIAAPVVAVERLRAVVNQSFSLDPLDESEIEYRLPLNLDEALRDFQASPGRMFSLPHDLNSTIAERTPNVFANYLTRPRNPR